MASPTQWAWIGASSGRQWKTEESGVLQSTGSQRVGHNLATEHRWTQRWVILCCDECGGGREQGIIREKSRDCRWPLWGRDLEDKEEFFRWKVEEGKQAVQGPEAGRPGQLESLPRLRLKRKAGLPLGAMETAECWKQRGDVIQLWKSGCLMERRFGAGLVWNPTGGMAGSGRSRVTGVGTDRGGWLSEIFPRFSWPYWWWIGCGWGWWEEVIRTNK